MSDEPSSVVVRGIQEIEALLPLKVPVRIEPSMTYLPSLVIISQVHYIAFASYSSFSEEGWVDQLSIPICIEQCKVDQGSLDAR